ncbi:hypothetical protein KUV57_11455 [Epibacterium sp. DP7N7-1]|nr:hypothetical protein [Epibacterium sp. DP7N7-1]
MMTNNNITIGVACQNNEFASETIDIDSTHKKIGEKNGTLSAAGSLQRKLALRDAKTHTDPIAKEKERKSNNKSPTVKSPIEI